SLLVFIPDFDPPEEMLVALDGHAIEEDYLVAEHVAFLRDLALLDHTVSGVVLHPRDKDHPLTGEFPKPVVVVVTAVDSQHRPRCELYRPRDRDVAFLAVCD